MIQGQPDGLLLPSQVNSLAVSNQVNSLAVSNQVNSLSNWTPRWRHVTQIHVDGSGWNDCFESSIARALMEYDPTTPARMANSNWDLIRKIHNPNDPASIWDLISLCSYYGRGSYDNPGQGFTSAEGGQNILDNFGVPWQVYYTDGVGVDAVLAKVKNNSLVICWVDGTGLYPASFPASYFGGDYGWDHIILSLPDNDLFNDPLTVFRQDTGEPTLTLDVRYSWDSIQNSLGGCWVIPPPEGMKSVVYTTRSGCSLKTWPNHLGGAVNPTLTKLDAGTVITLTGPRTPNWIQVQHVGFVGWILINNVIKS